MTDIVIVGKAYYTDLRPDQGLPPGSPGSPSHPWVPPGSGGVPSHPIVIPGTPPGQPGSPTHPIYVPIYPDQGLPQPPLGIWGGRPPAYPDQGLPGGQGGSPSQPIYHPGHPDHGLPAYPDQGLPGLPPGTPTHPWVPPEGETLPPPPADIADSYVVAVWNPTTDAWKVSVAEVKPTPHG